LSAVDDDERPAAATANRIGPVSVVVCNYNGEGYLQGCLESLFGQEGGVDEVIVVDNASTDRSLELVRTRFPEARIVEVGRNGGPSIARNVGMRAARNRWVLAVDNDAVLLPDVLRRLRAALEERPDAVLAQTRNLFAGDVGTIHYDGGEFHYTGVLTLRNFYTSLDVAEGTGVVDSPALIAICALLDRDAVLRIGGYDEDYFYLFEDSDLSLRLRLEGYSLLVVEDALTLHRGGTPGMSFRAGAYPARRAFFHSRNRWIMLLKLYRWRTLLVGLPGILAYEFAWMIFTFTKGHAVPYLRGKLQVLLLLPRVFRKRRPIQRHRRLPDRELLVGGPLTMSPLLLQSTRARVAGRMLDGVLRGWWSIARWLSA
jgi:GT2 family glycosyltransferase